LETFLHLTSLELGNLRPGEPLEVPAGRQSLYWRNLLSRSAARELGTEAYLHRCLKELVFESVRSGVDPSLPSRSECMFLFAHEVAAADCEALLARDPGHASLLAIEPLAPYRMLRARRSLLDVPVPVPDIAAAAEAYWRGAEPATPAEDIEVLLTGGFRVVDVVREGDGPRVTVEGRTFAELFRAGAVYGGGDS
jgi:hypothetical protein